MSSAPSKAEYGAKIALVNAFTAPLDNAVAAARTCYSSRIISPEEVHGSPDSAPETLLGFAQKRDNLARDLLRAGHHTVFQHAYFQFTLEGVSRQFVWSFLHNHTFYNSEQVSQRYVPVREGSYVVPDGLSEARKTVFRATVQAMFSAYNDLCALLEEPTAAAFFERFPSRRNKRDKYQRAIQKKAMEAARYVLPVATRTHLYHTVSGITLLRYHQRCLQGDAPWEQTQVVSAMLNAVLAFAPEYKALIDPPLEPTHPGIGEDTWPTLQPADSDTELAHREFDAELAGRTAHLVAASSNPDRTLALAVRQVLGLPQSRLSDEDAVRLCLDPAVNQHLAAELNLTDMDPISRAMAHVNFTFMKKLSHTADSQDQRHRMTPGSRPLLRAYFSLKPDFIEPVLIQKNPQLQELFHRAMQAAWEGIHVLLDLGTPPEFAAYLLPNALALRFVQSNPLDALWHKARMRLCYNAQEEIWRATTDEVAQIRNHAPIIGRYLLPPCSVRHLAGKTPVCPEGVRYCGVPVWKLDLSEYQRII
ncbi:MAG: FAD-dependent thymidylate synthase [Verrucomicrobiota bacterium]|jgi:flavin-dependent thymidylate synthase|nr:FAD-dependent thymidylate synthase [Verrucomicrobiota bacterium]MDD8049851.1 FAD-dependent thymidylate synthase [Verrucomicrobiota bacterium]